MRVEKMRGVVAVSLAVAAMAGVASTSWGATAAISAIRGTPLDLAQYQVGGKAVDGTGIDILQVDTEVSTNHPAFDGKPILQVDFTNPLEGLQLGQTQFFNYASGPTNLVWLNDFHGTGVASVMVGTGLNEAGNQTGNQGVAPAANLGIGKMWTGQLQRADDWGISALMSLSKSGVRKVAILEDQSFAGAADGTGNFALAADYVAYARNVTVVIPGGNNGPNNPPFSRPADAFNGLTVGATDGTFNQVVGFSNSGPTDGVARRKPDVVAPGFDITLAFGGFEDNDGRDSSVANAYQSNVAPANLANLKAPVINAAQDADPDYVTAAGTSFAAPHVAGQVALLQQWGAFRGLKTDDEVLRAVVVNSADKLNGVLTSNRTLLNKAGQTFVQSAAFANPAQPLDNDLGAGQVDILRSFVQYDAGEYGPTKLNGVVTGTGEVPLIGFDEKALGTQGDSYDYTLDTELFKGNWLSATLAWDREVVFNDANGNGLWDVGADSFTAKAIDFLEIWVLKADEDNLINAVASSTSFADNLQHVFFQVPDDGKYKIRVRYAADSEGDTLNYGLAWWAAVPEPSTMAWMMPVGALAMRRRRS